MTSSLQWTPDVIRKDIIAGIVTGLMAIPLTVGICLMSEYPIQIGLLTVIFACFIGFITFLFKPGNYVGTPGVAAGLAPVLAMGIHTFGMENMPFLIMLTSVFQMLVWHFKLENYILKAVPSFLVEGLLAGVGIKIALKFFPYTHELVHGDNGWTEDRMYLVMLSIMLFILFIILFRKYSKKSPGIPYIATLASGAILALWIDVPMLHIEATDFKLLIPKPYLDGKEPIIIVKMIGFALMLAFIDVIEQVMSNVAIGKLDVLNRPTNTNNSLLAIWIANLGSSFFGGMTNLDGLAKSATNAMAGAVTKLSNLVTGLVLLFFLVFSHFLTYLPEFSLAVLMIFTGWKMFAGVFHVATEGKYALILSLFCCILVWQLGIFEGLLISLGIHSFVTYFVYRHHDTPNTVIVKTFFQQFAEEFHPYSTKTMAVVENEKFNGALKYVSLRKPPSDHKSLSNFINDWGTKLNAHTLLGVVGMYDYSGLLWGTFAKELKSGHPEIKKYFEHLMELDELSVHFDTFEIRGYGDIFLQSGSYTFSYTKKGHREHVPARYSFVCRKDKNAWVILEHHSSQFPS